MEKRTWIRVDCNTSLAAQEEEPSDCDSDEHSITDLGYNVIDTDEKREKTHSVMCMTIN